MRFHVVLGAVADFPDSVQIRLAIRGPWRRVALGLAGGQPRREKEKG
jgi:hypothetical protein